MSNEEANQTNNTERENIKSAHSSLIAEKSLDIQSDGAKFTVSSKSDIQESHSRVSLPHSGSVKSQEEEEAQSDTEYGPYGKYYEEITEKHLKQIALELGLVKLYWPDQLIPDVNQYVYNYISS
jgi:hypothetical protein